LNKAPAKSLLCAALSVEGLFAQSNCFSTVLERPKPVSVENGHPQCPLLTVLSQARYPRCLEPHRMVPAQTFTATRPAESRALVIVLPTLVAMCRQTDSSEQRLQLPSKSGGVCHPVTVGHMVRASTRDLPTQQPSR
jgi:hypothetical protein